VHGIPFASVVLFGIPAMLRYRLTSAMHAAHECEPALNASKISLLIAAFWQSIWSLITGRNYPFALLES
jgi:hypothetical protein